MDLQESFEALDSRAPDTYAQAVEAYCDGILRLHWNERLINKIFGRALQSHAAGRLVVQHYQWQLRGAPRPTLALLQRRMPGGARTLATFFAVLRLAGMVAVDIDPAAVESTILNAEANQVRLQAGLPDAARGEHDLVLANILATPLKVLAPLLCARVAEGGSLVLAGILERQADELKQAYAPYLALEVADSEDGWILMTARRAA